MLEGYAQLFSLAHKPKFNALRSLLAKKLTTARWVLKKIVEPAVLLGLSPTVLKADHLQCVQFWRAVLSLC